MASPYDFAREFLHQLEDSSVRDQLAADFPAYDPRIESDKNALNSRSRLVSFRLGTGASIYTNALVPAILCARSEVILVTCFWARSESLRALSDALTVLAARRCTAIERRRQQGGNAVDAGLAPLVIRICFSSRSLLQKVFHTQSRRGYVYPPATWQAQLGLPDPAILRAGHIDLAVKSLFFLPFSVAHPKYVIIDRERAFLPSCNVSWEPWLEGCVEIAGDAVAALLDFYGRVWEPFSGADARSAVASDGPGQAGAALGVSCKFRTIHSTADVVVAVPASAQVPTMVLPSSHHRNPRFRLFPWSSYRPAPDTPLNVALLRLFATAEHDIHIQTPDLTSHPALASLLDAVKRGVHVSIVTCRDIKPSEQLMTAGTLTSRCVRSLVARYKAWRHETRDFPSRAQGGGNDARSAIDIEAQALHGRLHIAYFRASPPSSTARTDESRTEEPTQSHFKLSIVDCEFTMLGSGNMDRASWYTSQELGVLFQDKEFAGVVRRSAGDALRSRLHVVFDSDVDD